MVLNLKSGWQLPASHSILLSLRERLQSTFLFPLRNSVALFVLEFGLVGLHKKMGDVSFQHVWLKCLTNEINEWQLVY